MTPSTGAVFILLQSPVEVLLDLMFIIVLCPRLSGESPFQGNSDAETLALVTAAHYEFEEETFEDISEQAKDFISSLLQKDRKFV